MKMLATGFTVLLSTSIAFAEPKAGPRGGKLLENESPIAELLIEKDRTASIAFYDDAGKQVPATGQVVTATAEAPSGKARIDFEKKGDVLVAKSPLPEGEGYNVVLQIRKEPAAKPQNFRVSYNMHICGECNHPEYACTCDH